MKTAKPKSFTVVLGKLNNRRVALKLTKDTKGNICFIIKTRALVKQNYDGKKKIQNEQFVLSPEAMGFIDMAFNEIKRRESDGKEMFDDKITIYTVKKK